jgi:photosynthesis system II assembly factor YCF48-like protein/putative zinc finger protein
MSDVPKIVYDRLQAAAAREAHPDADVLAAFAEQALSGAEREGVVRHLARCSDCREVVALSIPPSVEAAVQPAAAGDETPMRRPVDRSRTWFAWPNLRWAALASGVVVVASVVLLRPGTQTDSAIGTEKRAAQVQEQVPAVEAKPNSLAPPATQLTQSYARIAVDKADRGLAIERRAGDRDEQPLGGLHTRAAAPPGSLTNDQRQRVDSLGGQGGLLLRDSPPATAPRTPATPPDRAIVSSNETVEVTASQSQIRTETATVSPTTTSQQVTVAGGSVAAAEPLPLNGRNVAPPSIVKAKPAAKEKEEVQTEGTVQNGAADKKPPSGYSDMAALGLQKQQLKRSKDAVPQWSLAQGKLQRSVDAGATWQIALQLEHPLLSFGARGSDVWAGGQSGTLFHSADSGTTWAMVQPSTNAGALAGDIVAIDIRSAAEILLSTSGGESWITADAGKTWEKK